MLYYQCLPLDQVIRWELMALAWFSLLHTFILFGSPLNSSETQYESDIMHMYVHLYICMCKVSFQFSEKCRFSIYFDCNDKMSRFQTLRSTHIFAIKRDKTKQTKTYTQRHTNTTLQTNTPTHTHSHSMYWPMNNSEYYYNYYLFPHLFLCFSFQKKQKFCKITTRRKIWKQICEKKKKKKKR